jgi:FAD/FMN-containing dehydrogenase
MLDQTHIDKLVELIGIDNIKFGELSKRFDPGMSAENLSADIVASPTSSAEVASLIEYCNDQQLSIVPQGGRTGLSGAAESEPGQLILDTQKMNQIIDIDFVSGVATVEAGVKLEELQNVLTEHGFSVGIDLAARGSATIGGMASTNAGGTEAFRFGTMRNRVLGLEAILPNGEIFSDLKQVVKANEGYDIKQLLIGAEGTLGVITKVVLALAPSDSNRTTALISCENAISAALAFQKLRNRSKGNLLCAEIMWPEYAHTTAKSLKLEKLLEFSESQSDVFVIVDIATDSLDTTESYVEDLLTGLLDDQLITSAIVAQSGREAIDIWKIREESFLCDEEYPHGYWYDMSVPLVQLDQYVEDIHLKIGAVDEKLKLFLFGHLGDGNLHLTVSSGLPCPELQSQIDDAIYDGLREMGGSFSAEHGIGNQKASSLEKLSDPQKYRLMQLIKSSIDPNNIMNPRKIFLT